tara:strand:- start:105 stop:380 length:276 start_codon:yes stop_codon:yes gene_type:complete
MTVNLRGMVMTCKHVLPVMHTQKNGAIVSTSYIVPIESHPYVIHKKSKVGVVTMTEQLVYMNSKHGIRASVILPGLMHASMASIFLVYSPS